MLLVEEPDMLDVKCEMVGLFPKSIKISFKVFSIKVLQLVCQNDVLIMR